jgi:hypothetical protein
MSLVVIYDLAISSAYRSGDGGGLLLAEIVSTCLCGSYRRGKGGDTFPPCPKLMFFLAHKVQSRTTITTDNVKDTVARDCFCKFFTTQKYSNTQKANEVILCTLP